MKIRLKYQYSRHGIALVLVMMTIIVLSAIVGSLAISMTTEMRLARNTDYDAQMEWMGRSGIELARYALANKCAGAEKHRRLESILGRRHLPVQQ